MITGKRLDTGEWLRVRLEAGKHILVAGITGFGKSNLINYYLWQLAELSHVSFVLCNAAGKPDYIQWLPRASSIAVGKKATDRALDEVLELMDARYASLIPEIPNDISDQKAIEISQAVERGVTISPEVPLILLVLDEFADYFSGRGGQERVDRAIRCLSIGRAAGIQAIFATQRPSDDLVNSDVREQMRERVLFASDANGAVMVFGPNARGLPVDKIATKGQGFALGDGQRMPVPFICPECNEMEVRKKAAVTAKLRPVMPFTRYIDNNQEAGLLELAKPQAIKEIDSGTSGHNGLSTRPRGRARKTA